MLMLLSSDETIHVYLYSYSTCKQYNIDKSDFTDLTSSRIYATRAKAGIMERNDRLNGCRSMRWLFAVLSFIGAVCVYNVRLNMSVVMTVIAINNNNDHTSSRDDNSSYSTCYHGDMYKGANDTSYFLERQAEFEWSSHLQELLLAAFYIGYSIIQGPSGWLADRIGGKRLITVGVGISALMNIIGPVAVRASVQLFFATRVISGLAEAVVFPGIHTLVAKWSPANEKTRIMSFITAGIGFGSASGQAISGVICSSLGWEWSFYILGGVCMIWVVFWIVLVTEEPRFHRFISLEEIEMIENTRSRGSNIEVAVNIPLRRMITSLPVLAWTTVMVTHAGFVIFILMTNLPLYMKNVQNMDVLEIGFLVSLPYIALCISMLISSSISDACIKRKLLTLTQTRKAVFNFGSVLTAGSLLGVCFVGCRRYLAVTLLTIAVGGVGVCFTTLFVSPQDLAPRFAGTLFGIGNCFSVSTGFIGPVIVGLLTENQGDPRGWTHVFYMLVGLTIFGALVYQLFGSGEEQEWAKAPNEKEGKDGAAQTILKEEKKVLSVTGVKSGAGGTHYAPIAPSCPSEFQKGEDVGDISFDDQNEQ